MNNQSNTLSVYKMHQDQMNRWIIIHNKQCNDDKYHLSHACVLCEITFHLVSLRPETCEGV